MRITGNTLPPSKTYRTRFKGDVEAKAFYDSRTPLEKQIIDTGLRMAAFPQGSTSTEKMALQQQAEQLEQEYGGRQNVNALLSQYREELVRTAKLN